MILIQLSLVFFYSSYMYIVEVNGYLIPKGTTLIANMHHIHHNEDFYPDADKFVPDRYLNDLRPMYTTASAPVEGRDQFNFGFGRY